MDHVTWARLEAVRELFLEGSFTLNGYLDTVQRVMELRRQYIDSPPTFEQVVATAITKGD